MAASVATDAADSVEKKERIAEAVSQMKSKNREILVAYSTLLQAWQQVNRALYLKREDKLQAQALAEKLRTIQEKIQAAYDEVKP